MGIGLASGESRATEAARMAINSPLLDVSINGARGVLFAIAGREDMTMNEIQEAARIITESVDANAKVIFGAIIDQKLRKGEIKITVIASGFPEAGRPQKKERPTAQPKAQEIIEEDEDEEEPESRTLFGKHEEKLSDAVRGKDKDAVERAIFNTVPEEKPRVITAKREEKFEEEDEDDDDDLGVIPSFLRRSKLR
jgi:ribosomal protein L12E/L44/L45/RPP1/RPP2